jgi:hypothetical protein
MERKPFLKIRMQCRKKNAPFFALPFCPDPLNIFVNNDERLVYSLPLRAFHGPKRLFWGHGKRLP